MLTSTLLVWRAGRTHFTTGTRRVAAERVGRRRSCCSSGAQNYNSSLSTCSTFSSVPPAVSAAVSFIWASISAVRASSRRLLTLRTRSSCFLKDKRKERKKIWPGCCWNGTVAMKWDHFYILKRAARNTNGFVFPEAWIRHASNINGSLWWMRVWSRPRWGLRLIYTAVWTAVSGCLHDIT